jgi:hypothetical protein
MRLLIPSLLLISIPELALSAPLSIHEAWDENVSGPQIMGHYFNYNFRSLPLKGSADSNNRFWSGDYWAMYKGSINYRWYGKKRYGFNLPSPDKEAAKRMTIPELAELSPSEKYDLLTGRYDYPLRNEVYRIANPRAESWEGICHGFSPASINHSEPTPKLLKNPDGLEIPFGSTDIKALISFYYAFGFSAPDTYQMGRRCFDLSSRSRNPDCDQDLNAGAFHVIIANKLGIQGKGFVADFQRYKEVWNHPVSGFSSQIINEYASDKRAAPGTVKVVQLKTILTYVDENGHDWQPVRKTNKQLFKTQEYKYEVELDRNGNIIGGEWISKQRPDFLWLMNPPRKFEGLLERLGELLNDY